MRTNAILIGDTNTIHGYNLQYQDVAGGGVGRYAAFTMQHGRPVQFHNDPVHGVPGILDHQGHIVPQHNYAPRLLHIATLIDNELRDGHGPYTLAQANARLVHHFPGMNFQTVTNYIQQMINNGVLATIFIDPNGGDVEERIGGYFSVINWNPVNICRAPSDNQRNGYPGQGADNAVALKLLIDQANPGITLPPPFAAFLQNNLPNLLANVDGFITAGNACLALTPMGYYQFNWGAVLTPAL